MLAITQARAYDFYAPNKDGIRIYYVIQAGVGNRVMVVNSPSHYNGIVNIPDSVSYEGVTYSVEEIGSKAFSSCTQLTEVILPSNLKTIRERAFYTCLQLERITIPDKVTTLRERAFEGCTALKTVSFGSNLATIDNYCFYNCSALESVILGDKVTTIEHFAFANCIGLKNVTMKEGITAISIGVFYGCNSLTSVILPNSIEKIGGSSFAACVSLTNITIPDGVITIENHAFVGCISLQKVILGENVSKMSHDAFTRCDGLKEFIVSEKNKTYSTIDGVLVSKDRTVLIDFPNAKSSDYIIPGSIKEIGEWAFSAKNNLQKITVPDHVTTVSTGAFANCENLTNITLCNCSIGSKAFQGCKKLVSIELPGNLSHVADSAFMNCTSLASITIPDGVITIGVSSFNNCQSMKNLTIGKGVISIGDYAFYKCRELSSILIPDNVISIGRYAFSDCRNVGRVTIGENVNEIGCNAFYITNQISIYNRNPIPQILTCEFYSGPRIGYPYVYVPVGSGAAYRTASRWDRCTIIERENVANDAINADNITIFNERNGISIRSAVPELVSIYTMSGQLVYQKMIFDRQDIRLSQGMYIIKANNITKKVFVEQK